MPASLPIRELAEIADFLGEKVHEFSGTTVLISGGYGFLGRYFLELFAYLNDHTLEKPCKLVVLDNQITTSAGSAPVQGLPNVTLIECDIVKEFEWNEPLDYIIHAAGIASPFYYAKYPLETLEVATVGTKNLLELGQSHRVKGFLFFSSSEIYGDPDPKHIPTAESYRGNVSCTGPRACYDESKRLGETLCTIYHNQQGVPAKVVRPFNVYGPGLNEMDYRVLSAFASRIKGGRPLRVFKPGNQTRTFCYVSDAINGFLRVLLEGVPGEPYNIGNPAPEISVIDLVKEVESVVDQDFDVVYIEHPDAYPPDEPMRRCPDITKARLQLDYQPKIALSEGLSRFMDWALENYSGTA